MGMMRRVAILLAIFMLALSLPAHACVPILSAGFPGLFAGYVLWLLMSLGLAFRHEFMNVELRSWALWVPVGFVFFAIPALAAFTFGLALIPVLILIAFPMHLAVQFFLTLWAPTEGEPGRALRLAYYGVPLAVILLLGGAAKVLLYGENGGLRAFLWNYSQPPALVFFLLWIGVGAFLLIKRLSRQRSLIQPSAADSSYESR